MLTTFTKISMIFTRIHLGWFPLITHSSHNTCEYTDTAGAYLSAASEFNDKILIIIFLSVDYSAHLPPNHPLLLIARANMEMKQRTISVIIILGSCWYTNNIVYVQDLKMSELVACGCILNCMRGSS